MSTEEIQNLIDDKHTTDPNNNIPKEGHREIIELTGVVTFIIVHYQMSGIFIDGIYPILFTIFLQIGAIYILASIPYKEQTQCEVNRFGISRNLALIIGLYIYVAACIGEFTKQNLFNIRILSLDGVYQQIRDKIQWFPFQYAKLLCKLLVTVDTIIWGLALIVGARLIILSDTMQDIILNSLSAVFVIQLDNIVLQMILPVVGDEESRGQIFVSKNVNIYSYARLPHLLIHPVIPTIMVFVLFMLPYW
eukprot:383224_1